MNWCEWCDKPSGDECRVFDPQTDRPRCVGGLPHYDANGRHTKRWRAWLRRMCWLYAGDLRMGENRRAEAPRHAAEVVPMSNRVGVCPFCKRERVLRPTRCASLECRRIAKRLERARERQRLGQRRHTGGKGGWFNDGRT